MEEAEREKVTERYHKGWQQRRTVVERYHKRWKYRRKKEKRKDSIICKGLH